MMKQLLARKLSTTLRVVGLPSDPHARAKLLSAYNGILLSIQRLPESLQFYHQACHQIYSRRLQKLRALHSEPDGMVVAMRVANEEPDDGSSSCIPQVSLEALVEEAKDELELIEDMAQWDQK